MAKKRAAGKSDSPILRSKKSLIFIGKSRKKKSSIRKFKPTIKMDLLIKNASYLKGYELSVTFNTGETKIVNFSEFINENKFPFLKKYKQEKNFKSFKIENGNLVWGKDWDLIFPIDQIYKGQISL